jgi:hypothetical protein
MEVELIKVTDIKAVSRAVIGAAFGMHPSNVNRWESRGLLRNPDGKTFSLPDVISWRLEEIAFDRSTTSDEEAQKWLTAFRRERALLAEIERKKAEGELIKADDIYNLWAGRVLFVKLGLLNFKDRLPPMLQGKTRSQMAQILENECHELLRSYTEKGKYTPTITGITDETGKIIRIEATDDEKAER